MMPRPFRYAPPSAESSDQDGMAPHAQRHPLSMSKQQAQPQQEFGGLYSNNHNHLNSSNSNSSTPQYPMQQSPTQQPHSIWHKKQQELASQQHQQLQLQRSSPIAIVGGSKESSGGVQLGRPPPEDSDEEVLKNGLDKDEEDDDDDDDRVVDVERDAMKLRAKYGDRVIAATYQGVGVVDTGVYLKAPYLGSLSRSENYLIDHMPPMSLDSGQDFHDHVEPPVEIKSNYGSLRESHQRGTFLDGPSSYREPRSGQIRHLEEQRMRFARNNNNASKTPTLSIGERMQQSRKLKEIRQKQKQTQVTQGIAKATISGKESTKDATSISTGTSSLSAMMNKACKVSDKEEAGKPTISTKTPFHLHEENLVPTFGETEVHSRYDPPTMLSTSLTAFEVMMSSNQNLPRPVGNAYSYMGTNFGPLLLPPRSTLTPTTNDNTERLQQQQQQVEPAPAPHQFKPLARSLSDPTPHLPMRPPARPMAPPTPTEWTPYSTASADPCTIEPSTLALSDAVTTIPSEYTTVYTTAGATVYGPQQSELPHDHHLGSTHDQAAAPYGYRVSPGGPVVTTSGPGTATTAVTGTEHNPDTDGAFGDMDME